MPTRPPLSSTSPIARLGPPAAAGLVLALMAAVPGPVRPVPTQRVEIIPGEVWADVITVPAGNLELADEAAKRKQQRPPCTPEFEIEWEGLCWVPHVSRPPKCAPGLMPGAGYCLMRSPAPVPPNTSVTP